MIPDSLTGGDLVVAVLKALGVNVVFGVPGGQTLAIIHGIERNPGIRFLMTRHESAAASCHR